MTAKVLLPNRRHDLGDLSAQEHHSRQKKKQYVLQVSCYCHIVYTYKEELGEEDFLE